MNPVLIEALADGGFHSGEQLAERLGIGRAAIWKQLQSVEAYGLVVESVRGRGYRLARPLSLINPNQVQAHLSTAAASLVAQLHYWPMTDSTNTQLLAQRQASGVAVGLAEFQSAGRGRHSRVWQMPYGGGVLMSASWLVDELSSSMLGMSLVAGLSVVAVLDELGVPAQLKWPNDVYVQGRKLAGVLIELRGEAGGAAHVVLGLGLNYDVPDLPSDRVDYVSQCASLPVSKSELVARILNKLAVDVPLFLSVGFAAFQAAWDRVDFLRDRRLKVESVSGSLLGTGAGVDQDGALRVFADGQLHTVGAGEVRVRPT